MASEQAKDLRQRGIAAAKSGDKDTARQLLQQSIRLEPNNEAAWLWLASVARDAREKTFCLQKLLEINPQNETARKALAALQGAAPEPAGPAIRPIGGLKVPPPQAPAQEAQAPGVPLPSSEQLADALRQIDPVVREFMNPPAPPQGITWVHKTRRRAGEGDINVLRAQLFVGIAVFLVVLGVLGVVFVTTNPDARALVFAPTHTPTYTPTMTATSTPGLTPTPSPTPALTYTPSPTVPSILPTYNAYFPPAPTRAYPRPDSVLLEGAVALVERGNIQQALPTLAVERELVAQLFDPVPYYYESIAQAKLGDGDRALRLLEEAESKLTNANTAQFKPVLDAAYAVVYQRLAEAAFENGDNAVGRDYLELIQDRAEAAIEGDRNLADAYLALSRSYSMNGEFGQAMQVLNEAMENNTLAANAELVVEKGNLFYEQDEYDEAIYQAFVALYMNPATEPAHILRVRSALADNQPGLAVIYAQEYLFYFPGSPLAWKLLGDARVEEGNEDLAIAAYTQALEGEASDALTVEILHARADLYQQMKQYERAEDDLTRILAIADDPEVRAERMQVAYLTHSYAMAREDADALLGRGVISDDEINLLQARMLIDEADEGDDLAFRNAAGLLATVSDLPAQQIAVAQEYLARAQYELGSLTQALTAIDAALSVGETANRHYIRGLILEAQGEDEEAAREYEWVLAWSRVYPFTARVDAQDRLDALRET